MDTGDSPIKTTSLKTSFALNKCSNFGPDNIHADISASFVELHEGKRFGRHVCRFGVGRVTEKCPTSSQPLDFLYPCEQPPTSVLHHSQAVTDTPFSGGMNSPTKTPRTHTEERGKGLYPVL